MKTDLKFEFLVDKAKHTISVQREFAAKQQLVWDCHTKSELLDRWFAPKPFTTKTKSMNFVPGGHWHYAMVGPDGTHYWARLDFRIIRPIDNYTALDAFSDESGSVNPDLPGAHWDVTFSTSAQGALVESIIAYNSTEDLEKVIQMGMQEGLTSTLERLDELVSILDSK